MAARHGVCTFLLDPDTHASISDSWVADIKAIHPDLIVRVPIRADAHNQIDLAAYAAALGIYQRAGVPVYALLDQDFNRPWLSGKPSRMLYPNEPLGYQDNTRANRWIKDTCVRAGHVARALAGAGVTRWIIGNEGNLKGHLAQGANVPPSQDDKGPAMAPEAYYSYIYECAGWLRAAGATAVVAGSLSWLPSAGDDDRNPYCAGYLHAGLQYVHDSGVRHWPIDALSLNCEGAWTLAKAQAMAAEVHKILAQFNLTLPLHIGEWSWPNGDGVDAAKAAETFQALSSVADLLLFFQHPCREPNNRRGYALRLWAQSGMTLVIADTPASWYPIYKGLLAT